MAVLGADLIWIGFAATHLSSQSLAIFNLGDNGEFSETSMVHRLCYWKIQSQEAKVGHA